MNIRPEERLQLWNLFQACDLDRDGFIDVFDVRKFCQRTEFSEEYTPETIVDLFDMSNETKIGFEDFVAKKNEHDQLAYSERTSISSDLTDQIENDSLLDLDSSEKDYDSDLTDYSSKIDYCCETLPEKMSCLHLNSTRNKSNFDSSSGYITNSSLKSGNHSRFHHTRDRVKLYKHFTGIDLNALDLSEEAKRKIEQIHQVGLVDIHNKIN